MYLPWFGPTRPTREEVDGVAHVLIVRHGMEAPDEALHLCDVCRSLGAAKNEKLYRLAARKSAILLARAAELAHER